MPPRQSRILQGPKDRNQKAQKPRRTKSSGRALDAFSIAEKQYPTQSGIKRHRLAEDDDELPRNRSEDQSRDEENENDQPTKRRRTEVESSGSSIDGGSDSEGNEWRIGEVDSDDDSEIDSDDALGSSDEELLEDSKFSGKSKSSKSRNKKSRKARDEKDSEDESDDLGEEAVDLATAWDLNGVEEEQDKTKALSKKASQDESAESDAEESSEDDEMQSEESDISLSDDDEDEASNQRSLLKLQSFVKSMEDAQTDPRSSKRKPIQENENPTEFGLKPSRKLTMADLMPSITDPRLKASLKHMDTGSSATKSKSGIPGKLEAPLSKREQDRLDRSAAYDKSKETLDRWIDTVKANRRAEHISFPLPEPDAPQPRQIGAEMKPRTDLESTIQSILQQSGLAETNEKSAEDQIQEFEELQAKKLPLEEIQARRAELRKARELMFREEARAKRIKKIKSKSYRRVHRKERERMEEQEKQALAAAGIDVNEEDRERADRRRAEARMGAKHRESKWAKGVRQSGRDAWDEDARSGMADLARRGEELQKRIEGRRVINAEDGSSDSESEEDDDLSQAGSDAEAQILQRKLSKLNGANDSQEIEGPHAKLLSMKFMRNAEASHKAANDAEIRQLNREFGGGDNDADSEEENETGRRRFGKPQHDGVKKTAAKKSKVLEFEERPGSDDDEDATVTKQDEDVSIMVDARKSKNSHKSASSVSRPGKQDVQAELAADASNPWLSQSVKRSRKDKTGAGNAAAIIDMQQQPKLTSTPSQQPKNSKRTAPKTKTVANTQGDSDDEGVDDEPFVLRNEDLVKKAFAGDDVLEDFIQEKLETVEDEGDKVVDNTLPGWGSWTGDGVSKKQQKRAKRFLTTVQGVKPEQRRDAKLDRVIINEKRVKKNTKYMATQLPHPFENRQQYERSLRLPIGPEWTTKETHQTATKPRVMVKQGIIKPMERPLV